MVLFELENVDLEFCEDVLKVIVVKVMKCKTGVCGLCLIFEVVLLEIMYELFLMEEVSKVVIDEFVINGEFVLLLIYSVNES